METPQKSASEIAIEGLDAIYSELINQAEALKHSFFLNALALHEGKPGHIPLVIRISDGSLNSKRIEWMKIILTIQKGERIKIHQTINKGVGSRYRVGSFSFVKEPLKGIVRAYETQLGDIREACMVNRKIRRQLIPHTVKAAKIVALTDQIASAKPPATQTEEI